VIGGAADRTNVTPLGALYTSSYVPTGNESRISIIFIANLTSLSFCGYSIHGIVPSGSHLFFTFLFINYHIAFTFVIRSHLIFSQCTSRVNSASFIHVFIAFLPVCKLLVLNTAIDNGHILEVVHVGAFDLKDSAAYLKIVTHFECVQTALFSLCAKPEPSSICRPDVSK